MNDRSEIEAAIAKFIRENPEATAERLAEMIFHRIFKSSVQFLPQS